MAIKAYFNFNGNCREAVAFYTEVFGTEKPKIMLFGDAPARDGFPLDEVTKNLVMHTEINYKDSTLMFSDVPPGMPFVLGNNISLIISSNDLEEIKTIFHKLKVDGNIIFDLQETFWSKCYGYITDKFGIGWQLSYES